MKLTSSPRNTILMVGALASLAAFQLDQELNDRIAQHLTVTGGTPAVAPAQLDNLQQLYPLLVQPQRSAVTESAAGMDAQQLAAAEPLSLDQLFGKTGSSVAKAKSADVVDYFDALNQTKAKNIRLDGVAPGVGAVINGVFVPVGDPIQSLEYPAGASEKKMVVPRLATITSAGIAIREPGGSRTIIVTIKP